MVTVMMTMRTIGKGKESSFLHHGMTISFFSCHSLYQLPTPSPANVPQQVQEQFAYLFSLSTEKEYVDLLKLAADVPVRAI
jgi:hypothetical protein